ncbi:MAG: hypothetical protein Q8927_01390 [Bacteroidota bacterium]|nr:hypothetical protein [Bacteroidota bacterium]MDP4214823.1 hypothetical protein [Bacteroidota bacterium]MDP4247233.1 hypothetical protein [Bacteroidota bacterium]MDP4253125.1 hypothetical protein [Bacteroidota bacterium]MDP4259021.1 hypothetical protein [Bacteroidota bacterium]
MRTMFFHWVVAAVVPLGLSQVSCDHRSKSGHDLELLTHSPWKYEKAGFDSDEDGVFDALDPSIAGCEVGNTVVFKPDGTGSLQSGLIKCKVSDPDSLPFIWAFSNNDSSIYFQDQYYKVRALDKDHFEIYADESLGESKTRYTIIFRH